MLIIATHTGYGRRPAVEFNPAGCNRPDFFATVSGQRVMGCGGSPQFLAAVFAKHGGIERACLEEGIMIGRAFALGLRGSRMVKVCAKKLRRVPHVAHGVEDVRVPDFVNHRRRHKICLPGIHKYDELLSDAGIVKPPTWPCAMPIARNRRYSATAPVTFSSAQVGCHLTSWVRALVKSSAST